MSPLPEHRRQAVARLKDRPKQDDMDKFVGLALVIALFMGAVICAVWLALDIIRSGGV